MPGSQADDFSKELCGGTHLTNTGEIGLFRVVSEESVAAGVRRITAVTGRAAYARAKEEEEVLAGVCGILSVPPAEIVPRVEGLLAELKRLRKEVHARKAAGLGDVASNLLSRARVIGETRVLSAFMEAATPDEMRQAMDRIRTSVPSFAAVLASVLEGKVHFVGGCSRNLVDKGLRVDNLLKSVAKIVGGGGGGRADLAQAGGTDTSNVDKALAEAERLLLKSLEG